MLVDPLGPGCLVAQPLRWATSSLSSASARVLLVSRAARSQMEASKWWRNCSSSQVEYGLYRAVVAISCRTSVSLKRRQR